ncbi:MAG: hypothetical protein B7Y99_06760 [Caulobacterales bacterium 32-69-10]|nr:MAG: hypothetical protein B7Y99_06760 [Caulobacterales bacterium 32-69-10]
MPDASGERDQAAIVEAFESGAAIGSAHPLTRIDTHMSYVFLGPKRAYKLKRVRRHPFADMSSLEARRCACESELAVNRALAPTLYEAVLPVIRGPDGAIEVEGPGEPIDWVVVMRRFADGALLSERAATGLLTPGAVVQAVDAVADFHRALKPHFDAGYSVDYRRIADGLRRTEAEGAAALGLAPASEALFSAIEREIGRLSPLIEARRRDGWVRRGHGDLHLGNICVHEGRVTPFDALEFDPALATADVVYDIAFLLMDLRARGLDGLANVAMNHYWDVSAQPEEALALLPLFTALRAAVRMAVSVEAADLVQAERYRTLGLALLDQKAPQLVAVGGLSGTGKSTVAKALAPDLPGACGGRLLRTDVIRKQLAGLRPTDRLAAAAHEPAGRAAVSRVLAQRAWRALEAGCSVVADATFREAAARAAIEAAVRAGPFTGLWLRTGPEVRIARIARRHEDASDVTLEGALAQTEPGDLGPRWRVLDAGVPVGAAVQAALEAVTESLQARGPQVSIT